MERPEMLGNAGERWWPASGMKPDWRGRGLPNDGWLVEEDGGVAAELVVVSAWRGDERNGGEVRRSGLGFGPVRAENGRRERARVGEDEDERETSWEGGRRTSPGQGRRKAGGAVGELTRAARTCLR
jgi:hypothetical protein